MARLIWTEPALSDLNEIAEYIALDNPTAAGKLVNSVFTSVERLSKFPKSGRIPPEMDGPIYSEVGVPPCRLFYRTVGERVYILHVMRSEMDLRKFLIAEQSSV